MQYEQTKLSKAIIKFLIDARYEIGIAGLIVWFIAKYFGVL